MTTADADGVLDALRARLEEVAEHLADLQMRALSDAVDSGQTRSPEAERQLGRARRSVERAAEILRNCTLTQQ